MKLNGFNGWAAVVALAVIGCTINASAQTDPTVFAEQQNLVRAGPMVPK